MSTPASATVSTNAKAEIIVAWLTDKKGKDIVALDLAHEKSLFEAVVIATATSVRHGQGLADQVLQSAKEARLEYLHMEGYATGQWILLDFNDVVVHIFQPDTRAFFRLEDLWPTAVVLADTRGDTHDDTREES